MEIKEVTNVLETILPGSDILESDIYFEPLSMSGLKEMHEYSIDERLYEFFEFKSFETINDTKNYINKLLNKRMSYEGDQKQGMYWFIRRINDKKLLGTACVVNIDYSRKSLEWGYAVDPELWGLGYILSIQESLKEYIFEVLKFNRIYGQTMITNKRTISSLLACGMIKEGILRDFYCKKGVFVDGWSYAMLKEDFDRSKDVQNQLKESVSIMELVTLVQSILEEENIEEGSNMENTPSWDSLSHMNIIVKIFKKYKYQLKPIEVSKARSIKHLYEILNASSKG